MGQVAANTALFRNGTLPRRAKPAKEEEAPAEVQAGQPSIEILQNGVNKERANSSMTPHAFEGLQERGVYSDKHSSRTCSGLSTLPEQTTSCSKRLLFDTQSVYFFRGFPLRGRTALAYRW